MDDYNFDVSCEDMGIPQIDMEELSNEDLELTKKAKKVKVPIRKDVYEAITKIANERGIDTNEYIEGALQYIIRAIKLDIKFPTLPKHME